MKALQNQQLDPAILEWPVYMQRALQLAGNVLCTTPNPRVGCIIVNNNSVVGEGWHIAAGQAHAEVMALRSAGDLAQGATAFVSLEPCAHRGRTGPCSQALIKAGIAIVVVAGIDPDERVAGQGIRDLEAAGIEVFHLTDFESEARDLNTGYFKRQESGLPLVRLKLAMSLDGRTALANGESKWITGKEARADVQKLRASSSAIITGINTVLSDDPALNVRANELALSESELMNNAELFASQPLRVIVDSQMRTHGTAKILSEPGLVKIFCNEGMNVKNNFANNVEIIQSISDSQGVNLNFMLEYLASKFTCNDVLIEAGPTLSGSFIRAGLVDELVVYIAPKLLGSDAKPLFEITGLESLVESTQFVTSEVTQIGTDIKAMLIRS